MYLCTAAGFERDIEDFLVSRFQNPRAASAWMQKIFDPDQMICAFDQKPEEYRSAKLLGLVQILFRNGHFFEKNILCARILPVLTLIPEEEDSSFSGKESKDEKENPENISRILFETALKKASSNALLVFTENKTDPKDRFVQIGSLMQAGLAQAAQIKGNRKVLRYDGRASLYPLYMEFIHQFDGSIVLDRHQLEDRIFVWKHQGLSLIVCYDENFAPCAFCTLESRRQRVILNHFVYDSIEALETLLAWAFERYAEIEIRYTGAEHFETIAAIDKPEEISAVYCRTDLELASSFLRQPVTSLQELFEKQTLPGWHNLY